MELLKCPFCGSDKLKVGHKTKCGKVIADGIVIYENGHFKDELLCNV